MEFVIAKGVLSDELGKLQSVIQKKPTIPILGFIKIESVGEDLKLSATNLETTIFSNLSSKLLAVSERGSMCVAGKQLFDIVKLLADGPVKVTKDENDWIRVLAKGSSFRLPGHEIASFPDVPDYSKIEWLVIPAKEVQLMIEGVKYAVTTDESRFNLRGLKLEIEGTEVRLIATDGCRVSVASAQLKTLMPDSIEILLPVEGITELVKLASDAGETIGVGLDQNNLFFKAGHRIIATRLMVGKFPSYQKAFSMLGTYDNVATFKADVLAQSIRRTLQTVDEKKPAVSMFFQNSTLKLNTQDADLGEAQESLESDFTGNELKVWCSGKYLVDFLDPLGSSVVRMEIKDNDSQIYVIGEHDGVSFWGCIMTMRP